MNKDFWDKVDILKKIAEKASPGPWEIEKGDIIQSYGIFSTPLLDSPSITNESCCVVYSFYEDTDMCCGGVERLENAEYIAAANPAMILEMIAEMRRLDNENDRLKIELHDMDSSAREMWNDMKHLEKEADWLAEQFALRLMDCPYEICKSNCKKTASACWREAARKAVEKQCEKLS